MSHLNDIFLLRKIGSAALLCLAMIQAQAADPQTQVDISFKTGAVRQKVVLHAAEELAKGLQLQAGDDFTVTSGQPGESSARIELAVEPQAAAAAESFRIVTREDGSASIVGQDPEGALWGVRDFVHYHASDWLAGLKSGKPLASEAESAPTLQNRGFWSWWYGCWDPYAYVDRASEWKLNMITFWNRGVPLDAERLNDYAHERGVKIWWGFSWGWVADDFKDASPELATRLLALYERQKSEIGVELANLCPQDPETPQALLDYVLDVYEHQYAWIPNIDGIYFQTATEATCPCAKCAKAPRGDGFIKTVLPIIEALHKRYPDLLISCGVHNKGDVETFRALKQIPPYANICWEAGVTWAPNREIARDQMTYRGAEENFSGVYRITMNCGLVFRDDFIRNEPPRAWLPRVDELWAYLEEGQPEGLGKGFRTITVQGQDVGYPCTSDWRPAPGGRLIDNPNFQELLTWSRELAEGPAKVKGISLLVEAGLIDLKMRRVPAMAAEAIWNPLVDENQLEARVQKIWNRTVGGWQEPANAYWNVKIDANATPAPAAGPLQDLGNAYDEMK